MEAKWPCMLPSRVGSDRIQLVSFSRQAMGLVNDHLAGCWVRDTCEEERAPVLARYAS